MSRIPKRQRKDSTVTVSRRPTDALMAKRQTVQVERKAEVEALTRHAARFMGTKITYAHMRAYLAEREAIREQQNGRPKMNGRAMWAFIAKRAKMSEEDCRILLADLEDIMRHRAIYDPIT